MKILIGFLWILLFSISSNAQTTRVGLQFDNVIYSEGDTVHFQGFVLENGEPVNQSKTLLVDWFGADDQLLLHQAYPIVNGLSAGQWVIPTVYNGACFKVLAYTLSQFQFDKAQLYHKEISLLGKTKMISPEIQLYPEGGSLISGVRNRIGYYFKGISDAVWKLVSSEDTLLTLQTTDDNYGSFLFTPESGKKYALAGDRTLILPSQKEGVAMETTVYPNSIVIMLRRSKMYKNDSLRLQGYVNGESVYESVVHLKDSGFVEIKTKSFDQNVMNIRLTDHDVNVVAARSVYIPSRTPEKQLLILSKENTTSDKKESWKLQLQDSLPIRFSVSIRDVVFGNKDSNIKSWLLLGKDVLDSLLAKSDATTMTIIDDRMRCSNSIPAEQLPRIEKNYYSLSGKVQGKTLPKEVNLIFRNNGAYQPLKLSLDADGHFRDSSLILFDSCYVALAGGQEGLTLELDTLPSATYRKYPFAKQEELKSQQKIKKKENVTVNMSQPEIAPELLAYGDTTGGHHLLPNVSVQSKKWRNKGDSIRDIYMSETFKLQYDNGFSHYDLNLDGDPSLYMGGATLWDLMPGRVTGFRDPDQVGQVFVDETEVSRSSVSLLQLPTVGFIRYIPRHAISLTNPIGGDILLIYSKKYTDPTLKERMAKNWGKSVIGYTSYIPFGQSDTPQRKEKPDNRKTLYWQPSVVLDKEHHELPINFTNNGIAKKLLLVVDGITIDGTPIHYEEVVPIL